MQPCVIRESTVPVAGSERLDISPESLLFVQTTLLHGGNGQTGQERRGVFLQLSQQELVVAGNPKGCVEAPSYPEELCSVECGLMRYRHVSPERAFALPPRCALAADDAPVRHHPGCSTVCDPAGHRNILQQGGRPPDCARVPQVVVGPEEQKPITCHLWQRLVPRIVDAVVLLGDPLGDDMGLVAKEVDRAVRGSAVNHDQLPVLRILGNDAVYTSFENASPVQSRYDNRNPWHVHLGTDSHDSASVLGVR